MNLAALSETGPECVHFASVAEIAAFLERPCDLAVFHLRAAELRSDDELLAHIAEAMSFPSYCGRTLQVLRTCLRDLAWHPAPGYVLIVWDAELGTPDVLRALRESWEVCAPYWLTPDDHDLFCPPQPTPFHLVFVGSEAVVFPPRKEKETSDL